MTTILIVRCLRGHTLKPAKHICCLLTKIENAADVLTSKVGRVRECGRAGCKE